MKLLLLGILSFSLSAFAQDNHFEHGNHTATNRTAIGSKEKGQIVEVLVKNDLLFNAFLKKDVSVIEKMAKDLHAYVSMSKNPLLEEVKAEVWNLASIKSSNLNEQNLKAYESFLKPLIKVVQSKDIGGKFNVFSCPMVKKSWIQNVEINKGVKNLYTMEMLECGSQDTHF